MSLIELIKSRESDDEWEMKMWNHAGRAAMFFCLWAAFIIPILLVIQFRFG